MSYGRTHILGEHISWEKHNLDLNRRHKHISTRNCTGDDASARVLVLAVVRRTFEPALTTHWTSLDYTLKFTFSFAVNARSAPSVSNFVSDTRGRL